MLFIQNIHQKFNRYHDKFPIHNDQQFSKGFRTESKDNLGLRFLSRCSSYTSTHVCPFGTRSKGKTWGCCFRACGPGNTAITACRSGAKVVGIDITPELLDNAGEEATIANAKGIEWKEADAEILPFEDQSFDVALSSVGHMFAPDPDVVTREILRVCKPRARIAFTTWPPEHAIGRIFTAVANHMLPLPDAPPSPVLWGIPEVIKTRLGKNVEEMHFERGVLDVPLLSENHYWHIMSTQFGPVMHALHSLDRNKAADLQTDFVKAIEPFFYGNILHLDYLLTVAIKG
ncbi:MAG: class I SAM-dependent methyltransferase [Nitrososphaeraceae archaeon]